MFLRTKELSSFECYVTYLSFVDDADDSPLEFEFFGEFPAIKLKKKEI